MQSAPMVAAAATKNKKLRTLQGLFRYFSDPAELFTTAVGFIEAAVPYDILWEGFDLP